MNFYNHHADTNNNVLALDGRRLEILLRNLSGIVVCCMVIYGFGYMFSRLIEQYTLLSSERQHDTEVLRMCAEERLASESTRMRSMCLQARADTSTPMILAAILKTCRLITTDFGESLPSFYSPYTLMIFGTILPWLLPLLRMCFMCSSSQTRIVVDEARSSQPSQHHVTFIVPTEWNANMMGSGWDGWKSPKMPPLLNFDCEIGHDKKD